MIKVWKKIICNYSNPLIVVLLCVFQGMIYLLIPFLTGCLGEIINQVSRKLVDWKMIIFLGAASIFIYFFKYLLKLIEQNKINKTIKEYRENILKELSFSTWEQLSYMGNGEILYRIYDLIEEACLDTFTMFFILTEIIFTIIAVAINVSLIMPFCLPIIFLLLPLCVWISLKSANVCLKTHQNRINSNSDYQNVLEENIENNFSINLNNDYSFFENRFKNACHNNIKAEITHQKAIRKYQLTDRLCRFVAETSIFLFSIIFIYLGVLQIGWLLVLLNYGITVFDQLSQINYIKDLLQGIKVSLNEIELINHWEKIQDGEKNIWEFHTDEKEIIKLDQAVPDYGNNNILPGYNIKIEKGDVILLKGTSGRGKTTMFRLIMRFLNMKSGFIYVNGERNDIYTLKSLREYICYMPQNTYIFEGTVLDNIIWGNETVDINLVIAFIKESGLSNLIMDENEHYRKITGKGENISGGERQRIGILRSIIKKSEIYLFDEPLSNLDVNTKGKMIEIIMRTLRGKTIIFISHDKILENYVKRVINIEEVF